MPLSTEQIASNMDGRLHKTAAGRREAQLPSPCIQNHAAFLAPGEGRLDFLWLGGSLESKADISIFRASLGAKSTWTPAQQLSDDPHRSEQNPLQFNVFDGLRLILNTVQPGGNQDACVVRLRAEGAEPQAGHRWNGSHDTVALAISHDDGRHWREIEVPESVGCVHMTLVSLGSRCLAAFFRRRQADFIYRSESTDNGGWTFPSRIVVDDNPGTRLSNDSLDGHNFELSYPSLIQGENGTLDLACTFYRRAIRHLGLAPEILEAE